ncbi:hypothetical protein BV372_12235 [Nostoc sp. T09]|nr:hypothetical protein BV372_12235 [Nostoc sp. T09]
MAFEKVQNLLSSTATYLKAEEIDTSLKHFIVQVIHGLNIKFQNLKFKNSQFSQVIHGKVRYSYATQECKLSKGERDD